MFLRYFLAWFPIVPIAFANAAARAAYGRHVGELAAHQISTLTLSALVGAYAWLLSGYLTPKSSGQALGLGLVWASMTAAFETGLGRYGLGKPWGEVFRDYNLPGGRVWPLFLLWIALLPYVLFRTRA